MFPPHLICVFSHCIFFFFSLSLSSTHTYPAPSPFWIWKFLMSVYIMIMTDDFRPHEFRLKYTNKNVVDMQLSWGLRYVYTLFCLPPAHPSAYKCFQDSRPCFVHPFPDQAYRHRSHERYRHDPAGRGPEAGEKL